MVEVPKPLIWGAAPDVMNAVESAMQSHRCAANVAVSEIPANSRLDTWPGAQLAAIWPPHGQLVLNTAERGSCPMLERPGGAGGTGGGYCCEFTTTKTATNADNLFISTMNSPANTCNSFIFLEKNVHL